MLQALIFGELKEGRGRINVKEGDGIRKTAVVIERSGRMEKGKKA